MADKTREAFEVWAMHAGWPHYCVNADGSYFCSSYSWEPWQAATQRSAARIAELEAECDAIAELNHAQWVALENVRHLAARNRKEEWAQHLLRFVEQAGTNKAQIMREQVDTAIEAERGGA